MRFSGPEAGATTPYAFGSIGIVKTVKEKTSVPSARWIMDHLHVFGYGTRQFAKRRNQRNDILKKILESADAAHAPAINDVAMAALLT